MKRLDPAHRRILDVLVVSVNPDEISVFAELIYFVAGKISVEESAYREGEVCIVCPCYWHGQNCAGQAYGCIL